MNTRKLYQWDYNGTLDKNISKLSKQQINLLIQQFEVEETNYKKYSKNYPPDKYKKYAVPFIKRIRKMIDVLKVHSTNG